MSNRTYPHNIDTAQAMAYLPRRRNFERTLTSALAGFFYGYFLRQ